MASAVKTRGYRVGKTEPISQFSWQVAANIAATGPSYIEVAIARLAVIRVAVPVRNHGAFFRQESIDGPGATPLTRIPFGPSCLAKDFT